MNICDLKGLWKLLGCVDEVLVARECEHALVSALSHHTCSHGQAPRLHHGFVDQERHVVLRREHLEQERTVLGVREHSDIPLLLTVDVFTTADAAAAAADAATPMFENAAHRARVELVVVVIDRPDPARVALQEESTIATV